MESLFIQIFLTVAILLCSVILHEYAHGWVAYRLGDSTAKMLGRLTLNPLKHIDVVGMFIVPMVLRFLGLMPLGWAKPVPVNFSNLHNPKRDMIWVAAAGPATNFVLAVTASQLLRFAESPLLLEVLQGFLVVNLVLATFNLIPVPPLDGSRIVMGLLPNRWSYRYAQMEPYGIILLIVLMNFGYLDFMSQVVDFFAKVLLTWTR